MSAYEKQTHAPPHAYTKDEKGIRVLKISLQKFFFLKETLKIISIHLSPLSDWWICVRQQFATKDSGREDNRFGRKHRRSWDAARVFDVC